MSDDSKIWPCMAFAKGQCENGDACPYRHDGAKPQRRPCRFFNTKKGCFRGARCPDLHNKSNQVVRTAALSQSSVEETEVRQWLFQFPKPGSGKFNNVQSGTLFAQGLALVEKGDTATTQRVIRQLGTEEGLAIIKALTDKMEEADSPFVLRTFIRGVVPFFKIISHPDVQTSLILETPLETIFNFLFGPSGRRAKCVLKFTAQALVKMGQQDSSERGFYAYSAALTAGAIVFRNIVELNHSAQLFDDLTTIVTEIESSIPDGLTLQTARRSLNRVKQRLGIGAKISNKSLQIAKKEPAVFEVEQDLPGQLSEHGPRHDNDHADIGNIRILPTADEIRSDKPAYLPSVNGSSGHLTGVRRLIDRQFRLLREDTVGQLRDVIRTEQAILSQVQQGNQGMIRQNKTRHFTYTNVQLLRSSFAWRRGFNVIVGFDQPAPKNQKREQWWEDSKRLRLETLVALVTPEKVIFFTVCDVRAEEFRGSSYPGLHRDAKRATVGLVMVEPSDEDLAWICMHVGNDADTLQSLVELPAVLLPSFKPTLQALQKMFQSPDIPFAEFLAPNETADGTADVPPPDYAQETGFAYNLAPIAGGERLTFTPGTPHDEEALQENSTLDDAQRVALLNALSRSLALIQGPPGTGKSYTGVAAIKVLLRSRSSSRLGPILCVCYTNHALDQLLEHLLDHEITKIIRIGTRSKSDRLQRLNLYDMKKQLGSTREESYQQRIQFTHLNSVDENIKEALFQIHETSTLSSVRSHLQRRYPRHFKQLFPDDEDGQGFKKVNRRRNDFGRWLNNGARTNANRPIPQLLSAASVWQMSRVERRKLHAHWIRQQRERLVGSLPVYLSDYTTHKSRLEKCQQELDIRCLQHADVIGVTTSGLAKNLDILQRVGSKVVVCEEAGEVLEAQTLTMLLPTVEHLILIGDHQQLRPQTNTYELRQDHPDGQKFSFDVSLFERLVDPKHGGLRLPYSTLEVQRRMHPSIAELVRRTLYPQLKDHPMVHEYPEVDGMRDRLFWLDHQEYEDSVHANGNNAPFSKTNKFEVDMVEALVSYLVKQGTYKHEDIAVLTPYLGQLRLIRDRLRASFEIVVGEKDLDDLENQDLDDAGDQEVNGNDVQKTSLLGTVRVATVDNFQGEEAKVVIISLVRSNSERKCGFLGTSNRINVLLSRARHGMYIIGNAETASSVPMWKDIISILYQNGNLGDSFALRCPRHESTPTKVSTPDHFAIYAPEGGCNQKCAWRLKCGHACITKCHSELLHSAVRCLERCQRTRINCDHPCLKVCGDPCSEFCEAPVSNVTLPCGHVKAVLPCHQAQDPETAFCDALVQVTLPHCKHDAKIACSQASKMDNYKCQAICGAVLACGHDCKRRFHECVQANGSEVKVDHGKCTTPCGRAYSTCGHTCKTVCHGDEPCGLCEEPCEVHCVHSQCKKKCFEPCVPCAEECSWSCPHQGKCQFPCAVPCDRLPCSKRCELLLECGHRCPSVCGEKCPAVKYCQQCGDSSVREQVVDYIMNETYAEVDLDENPCVIPSCGHIMTLESMDGYFGMSDYYEILGERAITALKSRSEPFSIKELKNCPICRSPLRNVQRYGRIVRRALIDEATKKFIVWANAKFIPLSEQLEQCVTQLGAGKIGLRGPWGKRPAQASPIPSMTLDSSSARQMTTISRLVQNEQSNGAIRNCLNVLRDIKNFLREVDEKEQPFTRVYDLMRDAHRHRGVNTDNAGLHGGPEILQVRHRILTTVLLVRCEYTILAAFLNSAHGKITVDLKANRACCDKLIDDCEKRKQPGSKVEGLVYWARFAALECVHPMSPQALQESGLHDRAVEYLSIAETICKEYPGQTAGLQAEIEETRKMFQYSTFYRTVTNEERAAVYAAMAKDFRGTGHWYYCQNGHPFTIGECGMPMESSVCPECGAPVGGQAHELNEGVTAATDLDRNFANLRV